MDARSLALCEHCSIRCRYGSTGLEGEQGGLSYRLTENPTASAQTQLVVPSRGNGLASSSAIAKISGFMKNALFGGVISVRRP